MGRTVLRPDAVKEDTLEGGIAQTVADDEDVRSTQQAKKST